MEQYFDPTCPGAVQVFVLVSNTLAPPVLVLCTSYGAVLWPTCLRAVQILWSNPLTPSGAVQVFVLVITVALFGVDV